MRLDEIIEKIENVSKSEVKKVVPANSRDLNDMIKQLIPRGPYEKMILGYLTSLCAEYMYPGTYHLEANDLDYVGFELEKGIIQVETAGDKLGSCMKSGKIIVKKAGEDAGSSMTDGEIVADEIQSIGNTIGGKIHANKVHKISKDQGAEIYIKGKKYGQGILSKLLGG